MSDLNPAQTEEAYVRNCGLHSTIGSVDKRLTDFSDESLARLLPPGYELLNGHDKMPSDKKQLSAWEKRHGDWRKQQFHKACVAVREVIQTMRTIYPKCGIVVTVPEDDWAAMIPPFNVRMQYTGPSRDDKKPTLNDDMDPMAKTA